MSISGGPHTSFAMPGRLESRGPARPTVIRRPGDYTQQQIGERIGWSRDLVKQYVAVFEHVGTAFLEFAKQHQRGRVPEIGTPVTFNFTEGWFRDSGLYGDYHTDCSNLEQSVAEGNPDKFNCARFAQLKDESEAIRHNSPAGTALVGAPTSRPGNRQPRLMIMRGWGEAC